MENTMMNFKLGAAGGGGKEPTEETPLMHTPRKQADLSTWWLSFLWFINEYDTAVHLVLGIVWIQLGVELFQWAEHCWMLSAYFEIVQIVTTIGYGDFVPENTVGRILTVFYCLGTILLLGTLINLLIDSVNAQMESMAAAASSKDDGDVHFGSTMGNLQAYRDSALPSSADIGAYAKSTFGVWTKTAHDFWIFALFIAAGTIFYGIYEACGCSYGLDAVKGCHNTSYAVCVSTGGYVLTWVDSFYMVVITLTTIGFGDYCPMSYLGRILFVPWAITGVIAMAKFATSFGAGLAKATALPKVPKSSQALAKDLKSLVGERKTINRLEFSWFLLSQTKRISPVDQGRTSASFKELDTTGAGRLGVDEVLSFVQAHHAMFEDKEDEKKEAQVPLTQAEAKMAILLHD